MRRERGAAVRGRAVPSRAAALVTALLAVLASACATVPNSGPVHEGRAVPPGAGGSGSSIRLLPQPPLEGEDPVDIVEGFLAASASFDGNHRVARLHLDPRVDSRWNPASGVVVYEGTEPEITEVADDLVVLEDRRVATIDQQGRYLPVPTEPPVRVEFQLGQVDGEWRIEGLPDRLLLTRADVSRSFRQVNLYYLDPDREVLVPDPVYLPLRRPGPAVVMTQALLRGPSAWLRPAVRTAFPDGSRLSASQVDVDSQGVATVDLTGSARLASPAERRQLSAQLVWTLRQLPGISGVRVTVGSTPLDVPGAPSVQSRDAWGSYDPAATPADVTGYLVSRNRLFAVEGADLVPVQRPPAERAASLRHPAISLDGRRLAALTPSADALRVGMLGPREPLAIRLRGTGFTPPSWDRLGNVWTAGRPQGSSPQVWVVGGSGQPRRVEADLGDVDVLALRVARDGTRVAVVTRSAGVHRLLVGRVVRGASLRIEALTDITGPLTVVRDVAWAEPDRLAVLGRGLQGPPQVWVADVDGSGITSRGSVPGMVSVAAASSPAGALPLLVGTQEGVVYQNTGGPVWPPVSEGRDPVYPG